MFAFEPAQPVDSFRRVEFDDSLVGDQVREIPGMLRSQNIHFTTLCKSFQGVGPDGLEHPEARLAVGSFLLPQEAVIDQRCKTFENIELAILITHCLGGLQRESANEN